MLEKIVASGMEEFEMLPYREAIEKKGGTVAVADEICARITPEILALQGQEITAKLLNSVRQSQDRP